MRDGYATKQIHLNVNDRINVLETQVLSVKFFQSIVVHSSHNQMLG